MPKETEPKGIYGTSDVVSIQKIITERIEKEAKCYKPVLDFSAACAVKNIIVLPEKINDPHVRKIEPDAETLSLSAAKNGSIPSNERFEYPRTSAMEIGWFTKQLIPENTSHILFHHPQQYTEVSQVYGKSMMGFATSLDQAKEKGKAR